MPNFDFYRPANGTYGHENGAYINSAPTTIIDDFEDNDLSEYGVEGTWSVIKTTTYNGSYAVENTGTAGSCHSTTGLNAYPSAGDTFSMYGHVTSWGGYDDVRVDWACSAESTSNIDMYRMYCDNDYFRLQRWDNGSITNLTHKTNIGLSTSTWYEFRIDWGSGGSITADIINPSGTVVSTLSTTDSTYTSGGFGFGGYSDAGTTTLDYALIK